MQWWEPSPTTNVSRVRFPDPASYVGWVYCWFSTLLREVFLQVLRFSFFLKANISKFYFDPGMHGHFWNEFLWTPWYSVGKQITLLYNWRFSRYSAPIHWLDHGHMTPNNETVSRQMPWAGNIAKTMTSNGKQFTVIREMLTAVASDRWNLSAVFKFCFCLVLLYNKSLNDWSLG